MMESESCSSRSSGDDYEVIMLLNSTIFIATHSIDYNSTNSTDSENKWDGSPKEKSPNIPRDFEGAFSILIHHHFNEDELLYNEATFE